MADDLSAITKQVKEANDIVEVVGGYVALRQQGQTYKGLCPFHEDHRPSFDVDPRRQRYRCWSCQKSGDVFTFIMERERVDFLEARELLARRAGITLEKAGGRTQNPDRAGMIEAVQWAAELYHACLLETPTPEAEAARVYLGERKLTGETVRRFGLGFAPPTGDWLVRQAVQRGLSFEVLDKVGLVGAGCRETVITIASATGCCFPSATCGVRWWGSAAGSCRRLACLTGHRRNTTTRPSR